MTHAMFQVGVEDADTPLCRATTAEGLFVETEPQSSASVIFSGLDPVHPTWLDRKPHVVDFLEVDIISTHDRLLGNYTLGRAAVTFDVQPSGPRRLVLDRTWPIVLPDGLALWHRWCDESRPIAPGEWTQLDTARRRSWLAIAQSVWGVHGYTPVQGDGVVHATLDTRDVTDETSFYLALGEAIVGPGGYLGSTLDGLDDALMLFRHSRGGIHLQWRGLETAHRHLGTEFMSQVREILTDRGVATSATDQGT